MDQLLKEFETISLQDMDSVKLMNRKECKYSLSYSDLKILLNSVKEDYYIMTIDGHLEMPYKSEYYDEPDFSLYTSHQNGKQNRYKVRSRTYAITGQKFLELKFKSNKRRTIKNRVEFFNGDPLVNNYDFIKRHLPFSPDKLEKKIEIKYNRITLVDKNKKERVTIDLDLSYKTRNKSSVYNGLAIIEVKYQGEKRDSLMVNKLLKYRIKPLSLSKYCLGISQHYPEVKQNSMNIKVRELNKLLYNEVR